MTLKNVIEKIGGNSEMTGTPLSADCLTESATLVATRGGYDIYQLECGDFFLSHDSGSTHLVTSDDSETEQGRVVGAATEYTGDMLTVIFDNGGGITVQARGFVHNYDNPKQAAADVKGILSGDDPEQYDGDQPEFYQGFSADPEIERNGGYVWRERDDLAAMVASAEPIDPSETSGYAEQEFLTALTGRAVAA